MLTALIVLALTVIALVVLVLGAVAIGIRHDSSNAELSNRAPNLIATAARHVLGLHVHKPQRIVPSDDRRPEGCLSGRPAGGIRDERW